MTRVSPPKKGQHTSSRKGFFFEKTVNKPPVSYEKSSPIYSLLNGQRVGQIPIDEHKEIDKEELIGYRRTVAGLEWLLLVLVLLCTNLPWVHVPEPIFLHASTIAFALFICVLHYIWRSHNGTRWKLSLNMWGITFFITSVVWETGSLSSPLLPLYFVIVLLAGTTLGTLSTLLGTLLATACYLFLGAVETGFFLSSSPVTFHNEHLTGPIIQLFLLWILAYFVTLISKETDRTKDKIRQLSRTDQLTGLWNMKMLLVFMQREYQRILAKTGKFSVLMIDADSLKAVNDLYGHHAGTMLIVSISEIMRSELREEDMLARFGGDEFVAFLPDTTCQKAWEIAEKMRIKIAQAPLNYEGNPLSITVSCGIACYPEHGQDLTQIMKMADKALYTSKGYGKNQCTIFKAPETAGSTSSPPYGRKAQDPMK
ncbi:diguanylate cyclase (GGDEF) domain-containing protein [Candidatus Electrothrix aarhusensis]|jgi:diguanylate cyclase (GGDEF)-like protein|uniref:diguanylate cyclase n=1 Tax=Candidatus Electrothrix aarhusensis TaxID=1859131 RepID=A0A444IXK6_9BACT|nr:diguanylate cyclase (GGDEF) domain-containing protein [Candidatus Electrothrix aarhusensis]